MHAQHMDIILIFARTRDVGLCRPCLHEKKTDMEQFGKILIVDDNEDVLFALNLLLEPYAEKIKVAVTPDRIEHFMTTFRPDIILLDMNFSRDAISGQEGFDSLKQILSIDPQAVVIFMTAYADTDKAVRAIKAGATDFIPKPWEKEKLLATLSSGMKLRRSRTEINLLKEQVEVLSNATTGGSEEIIIGDSPVMQQVFSTVEKLRDTDANILILGENGTCDCPYALPQFSPLWKAVCHDRPRQYPRTVVRKRVVRLRERRLHRCTESESWTYGSGNRRYAFSGRDR